MKEIALFDKGITTKYIFDSRVYNSCGFNFA